MENNQFSYTYSADRQNEVENIRKKYLPEKPDKMEQLRRLDSRVTKKSTAISIAVGIAGTLILGVGMCCCMVWAGVWFVPGIVIGILGMLIAAIAYPLYSKITKKERKKIAPEIIRLTDELMQ